jgi:transcriptional regulator with XRE-family HTH domain
MGPSNHLKQLRVAVRLTQAQVAQKVGVSQPNYQRWESGAAPVPEDKVGILSKVLRATKDQIRGESRFARVSMDFGDEDDDGESAYWGEVAIHFSTNSAPIVASISSEQCEGLFKGIQARDSAFFEFRGLCNEHYFVRRSSVSELYLTDEAADEFGAPEVEYPDFLPIPVIDPRLWDVLSQYNLETDGSYGHPDVVVEALSYFLTKKEITPFLDDAARAIPRSAVDSAQNQVLRSLGVATAHDAEECQLSAEEASLRKKFLMARASNTVIRLSTGDERSILITEARDFKENAHNLRSLRRGESCMVAIALREEAKTAFFSSDALDFVRFPAHFYDRAQDNFPLNVYGNSDSDDGE